MKRRFRKSSKKKSWFQPNAAGTNSSSLASPARIAYAPRVDYQNAPQKETAAADPAADPAVDPDSGPSLGDILRSATRRMQEADYLPVFALSAKEVRGDTIDSRIEPIGYADPGAVDDMLENHYSGSGRQVSRVINRQVYYRNKLVDAWMCETEKADLYFDRQTESTPGEVIRM